MQGHKIYDSKIPANSDKQIDLQSSNPGVYVITVSRKLLLIKLPKHEIEVILTLPEKRFDELQASLQPLLIGTETNARPPAEPPSLVWGRGQGMGYCRAVITSHITHIT